MSYTKRSVGIESVKPVSTRYQEIPWETTKTTRGFIHERMRQNLKEIAKKQEEQEENDQLS